MKEKIVCALTGQVRHFDNTITSIVEFTYDRLKK